ncbi:stalk domain-containing protein [Paenibacillus sp. YN15]|uniref:stalk domain-containing protein n=1 Tax=Paenibacillus sp. YN15 TaxID=1742774 RepID=UPI0015EB7A9D|nr:stalk domain-containing protein [Paenibacillus sp. YN15]
MMLNRISSYIKVWDRRRIKVLLWTIALGSAFVGSNLFFDNNSVQAEQASVSTKQVPVRLDGVLQSFDPPAVMIDEVTLVPFRPVFEQLGAVVSFDASTQTVTAVKDDKRIQLTIGSAIGKIGDQSWPLPTKAQLIDGTTMVPLRFISEALLANVEWDMRTASVSITSFEHLSPLKAKVNQIIGQIITPTMTNFQKIYAIHKYVVNHVTYDYVNYYKGTVPLLSYSAEGALLGGLAVCDGYTKAMSVLLDKVEIENIRVMGTVRAGEHSWNMVQLNGQYYHIDATWNDSDNNIRNKHELSQGVDTSLDYLETYNPTKDLGYKYFLVSSERLEGHTFPTSAYPKTSHSFDGVFSEAIPFGETADDIYVRALFRNGGEFSYGALKGIAKIDKNGERSYPFSNSDVEVSRFLTPIIFDDHLYYGVGDIIDNVFPVSLSIHRISLNSGEDTPFLDKVFDLKVSGKYMFYTAEVKEANDRGFITRNSHLRRILSNGEQDTLIAENIGSFLLHGNFIYYTKKGDSSSSNKTLHRVSLEGKDDTLLATGADIDHIDGYSEGILSIQVQKYIHLRNE